MRGHADDFPLELASAIPTREWNYVEEKIRASSSNTPCDSLLSEVEDGRRRRGG